MRVSYRCFGRRSTATYEQISVRFCCERMKGVWGDWIGFGIKGHSRTDSREVNLFGLHQFSTGTVIPAVTDIRYCPWCAEKIMVRLVKKDR
jgi:hypothetical protein